MSNNKSPKNGSGSIQNPLKPVVQQALSDAVR